MMTGGAVDGGGTVKVNRKDDREIEPKDGVDTREAMVEECKGAARTSKLANGYGGDDDSANDKEEVGTPRRPIVKMSMKLV
jgi:hypothetical protein